MHAVAAVNGILGLGRALALEHQIDRFPCRGVAQITGIALGHSHIGRNLKLILKADRLSVLQCISAVADRTLGALLTVCGRLVKAEGIRSSDSIPEGSAVVKIRCVNGFVNDQLIADRSEVEFKAQV